MDFCVAAKVAATNESSQCFLPRVSEWRQCEFCGGVLRTGTAPTKAIVLKTKYLTTPTETHETTPVRSQTTQPVIQ
jgi:hypothetical protein